MNTDTLDKMRRMHLLGMHRLLKQVLKRTVMNISLQMKWQQCL